ncbi:MAG: branched-chain amino acid ABC transporter permease [Actinomycetota bacterium]|nr:branched-chain amino acid ABC transporter permease [Actinomycetota bacterium]
MTVFITALVAGLAVGSVYGLIGISYSIVYSSSGIFNVAQGNLLAVGILVAYYALDEWKIPQVLALLLIVAVVVALSLAEELLAVRPIVARGSGGITWFISTLGFGLVVSTIAENIYGSKAVMAIPSAFGESPIRIGGVAIAPKFVASLGLLMIIGFGLEAFYRRSQIGTVMRAVAEDRDVAALRGIRVVRIGQLAFVMAGVITGLAAFVIAPIVSSDISLGLLYGLKGFIALAVGGFGSMRGAALGGLLLGVGEQMLDTYWSSNYEIVAGMGLILLVLAIRPQGLFNTLRLREV